MTREIKFRAWNRKKKQWHTCRNGGDMLACSLDYKGVQTLQVRPFMVVQQYTGLLDKNGKEIYEGDVLEYEVLSTYGASAGKARHTVVFKPAKFEYFNPSDAQFGGVRNFEVIGNIHESPELIEHHD